MFENNGTPIRVVGGTPPGVPLFPKAVGDGRGDLVTHHDYERNAEMLDAIFDSAHGRGVGHIAGIAGDEKPADAKPTEQQFRRQ